jgi:hypothetical protein
MPALVIGTCHAWELPLPLDSFCRDVKFFCSAVYTFCLGFVSRFCDFSNHSARFQTAYSIGRRSFDLLWVQNLRSFLSPLSLEVHKMYLLINGKDCCKYMFGVVWWWRRNCTLFWLFCGLFSLCSRWDMEQALRKGVCKTCVENASKCQTANCSSFSGWTVLIYRIYSLMFSLETMCLAFRGKCWVCCHNLQGGRTSSQRFVGNHARCRSCTCSKRDRKGKKVSYGRKFLCDFMGWVPGRL